MAESPRLERRGNTLRLQGRINVNTVPGLYQDFKRELEAGVEALDCSGLEDCDSAGVALLLACTRLARRRGASLPIRCGNEQVLSLARLYEVESLLRLENAASP